MKACCDLPAAPVRPKTYRLALAGNPNSGKTTLFNALTGLRAQTANYPGTTVERRTGHFDDFEIVDLPGFYDVNATSDEERLALNVLKSRLDGVIVVADATNLSRSLFLISQIIELKLPVVVALNMIDLAEAAGIRIDVGKLARELGCPVIP